MFSKLVKSAVLAAGFTAATSASAFQPLEEDPKVLNFGIISTESTSNLQRQWEPFLEDMEAALGMEVKAFYAPDYAGVIEGMRFGKVHVAWFGNKSAMEAVDRAGAEIFAQQTKSDGDKGYYSYVLAPAASKINNLDDLLKCDQSLDFGIGDPNSTSGFLVPSYYVFAQNGVNPKKCFKTVRNANHETNFMSVANGQVDAATNNSEQWARAKAQDENLVKKVKVIWKSPLIPNDPIAYRKDLSDDMKDKIKGFFLTYGRMGPNAEEAREVLANMSSGLGPFTNSDNTQLYPIRQLALFKDRVKIENSSSDPQEKKAKIAEIDAQLATLKVLAASQ